MGGVLCYHERCFFRRFSHETFANLRNDSSFIFVIIDSVYTFARLKLSLYQNLRKKTE